MAAFSRGLGLCGLKASPFSISRAFLNSNTPVQRIQMLAKPFSCSTPFAREPRRRSDPSRTSKRRLPSMEEIRRQAALRQKRTKEFKPGWEEAEYNVVGLEGQGRRSLDMLGAREKPIEGMDQVLKRLVKEDKEADLYRQPPRRWGMTTAIIGVCAISGYLIWAMYWLVMGGGSRVAEAAEAGEMPKLPVYIYPAYVATAMCLLALIAVAYNTRRGYVKRITLVPRRLDRNTWFEARIHSRGTLPFTTNTVEVEMVDLRTNVPLASKQSALDTRRPIYMYPGLSQPFVWLWRRFAEIGKEFSGTFVFPGRRKSNRGFLVTLHTDSNSHWYNEFSLDTRGDFPLGGMEKFTYFVEPLSEGDRSD